MAPPPSSHTERLPVSVVAGQARLPPSAVLPSTEPHLWPNLPQKGGTSLLSSPLGQPGSLSLGIFLGLGGVPQGAVCRLLLGPLLLQLSDEDLDLRFGGAQAVLGRAEFVQRLIQLNRAGGAGGHGGKEPRTAVRVA
jgi:hypothetical protein